MSKPADLNVTNLLLDIENPRLEEGQRNQSDAITAMLRAEGRKTLALAESIAKEGLSPAERLIVIQSEDHSGKYVVLDGNRRITALKMLSEPTEAEKALNSAQMKRLRKLGSDYQNRGEIEEAACTVFKTRDEAHLWIERRHGGDQAGVGVVSWGATEKARYEARRSGKTDSALQVLDFVSEKAPLDKETRDKLHDVPITNLQRLLRDKGVRETLGITIGPDKCVLSQYPDEEVLKGLVRIVKDLAHNRIKVRDIYTAPKRQEYLEKFKRSELPKRSAKLPEAKFLIEGMSPSGIKHGKSTDKASKTPKPRSNLIPQNFRCNVTVPKLHNFYRELRLLKLENYFNAVSVLLRVFLELSVDEVIEKEGFMTEHEARGSKLNRKVNEVIKHFERKSKLTKKQALAAQNVVTQPHISGNIKTFNEYIHNKDFSPSPADLRASWDNLELFIKCIWPPKVK